MTRFKRGRKESRKILGLESELEESEEGKEGPERSAEHTARGVRGLRDHNYEEKRVQGVSDHRAKETGEGNVLVQGVPLIIVDQNPAAQVRVGEPI